MPEPVKRSRETEAETDAMEQEVEETPADMEGRRVLIFGLQSRAYLNGLNGTVSKFHEESQRYEVYVEKLSNPFSLLRTNFCDLQEVVEWVEIVEEVQVDVWKDQVCMSMSRSVSMCTRGGVHACSPT